MKATDEVQSFILFENNESISYWDIIRGLLWGLFIVVLVLLIDSLRGKDTNLIINLSFVLVLLLGWVFKAFRATTLKRIEIRQDSGQMIVTIGKRSRKIEQVVFLLKHVSVAPKVIPDRFLPRNLILQISDGEKLVEISSREKGLSIEILEKIEEQLKSFQSKLNA